MDWEKMFERENENYNKIYLYMNSEKDLCNAYELSAYMLTRLFDTLELDEEVKRELVTILYVVRLSPQFVIDQFPGDNVTVGDEFIKVVIDDPSRCSRWKAEFAELKKQQQMDNCKLGKAILGFARLGKPESSRIEKTE